MEFCLDFEQERGGAGGGEEDLATEFEQGSESVPGISLLQADSRGVPCSSKRSGGWMPRSISSSLIWTWISGARRPSRVGLESRSLTRDCKRRWSRCCSVSRPCWGVMSYPLCLSLRGGVFDVLMW